MPIKKKILIIEDDSGVREGLVHIFSKTFEVECADNGLEGLRKAIRGRPEVILLDLNMPEMNGFQSCKAFRTDSEFDDVPIIILSAFNNVADRTKLFELGADDYITKPFDPKELLARIHRSLERIGSRKKNSSTPELAINSAKLTFGRLILDVQSKRALIDSMPIELGVIEFNLLHILILNSNELVSREDILEFVWEKQKVSTRLIDPHVLSLRSKLSGMNLVIRSVYGKGYILKSI